MSKHKNWTEDEVRRALTLYLLTDFGKFHSRNPDVIKLAEQLGRTKGAVAYKLANLAALDESIPQKGLGNVSKVDRSVWQEFQNEPQKIIETFDEWAELSICINTKSAEQNTTESQQTGLAEIQAKYDSGIATQRTVESTRRVGQEFFRQTILTSYKNSCALTGINDPRLLNASHIVAWKDDSKNRVNPTNGICLNALHDRAFDRHLITFDEDYQMIVAPDLPDVAREKIENSTSGELQLPQRFLPSQVFLEQHREQFHQRLM